MNKSKMTKIASVIAAAAITTGANSGCMYAKDENAVMYDNFVNHKIEHVIIDTGLHKVEHAGIQIGNERYATIETECGEVVEYPIIPGYVSKYKRFTVPEEQTRKRVKPLTGLPTKYYYTECECVKTSTNENTSERTR